MIYDFYAPCGTWLDCCGAEEVEALREQLTALYGTVTVLERRQRRYMKGR